MRKYWLTLKLTLEEYFVYRLNFFLWRFRSFLFFLTLVFFWQAVYTNRATLFGYSQSQMLAYVIGVAFLKSLVFGSRSFDDLPGEIITGHLSQRLIKPISLFGHFFIRDLTAKLLDLVFAILEIFLVIKFLKIDFYLPSQPAVYWLFFFAVFLALFLYFFLGSLLSCFAFWLEEVWATRWLFGIILLEFMSGVFFPLDILPQALVKIISLTPFPYLIYFPLKIWNQTASGVETLKILVILGFWLVLIFYLRQKIWPKGLKIYTASGN